jgi:subtilisin family serine protease
MRSSSVVAALAAVVLASAAVPGAEADAVTASSPASVAPASSRPLVRHSPGWALDRIDQRSLPLDDRYRARNSGARVTVYVVDCGAQVHNPAFGGRAQRGANVAGGTWHDCSDEMGVGHATFVSGIVAGQSTGVAPRARIVSVRALDEGEGVSPPPLSVQLRRVVRAIDWVIADAATRAAPAVVNLSLSFDGPRPRLAAALGRLERAGIAAVVAAGNDGGDACVKAPADVPTAVTVGATNRRDRRWRGSNAGGCVDLFAPGVAVRSVLAGGGVFTYRHSGATSWAAPFVTGAAALYLSAHPHARPRELRRWLVGQATRGRLSGLPSGTANRLLFAFASLA